MVVRKLALLVFSLFFLLEGASHAQSEARIRVVLPTIQQTEDDLKWLIELSPTLDLKKQWKKLKDDILLAFTPGFNLTKPFEVDLVFHKDEIHYDFRIPVEDLSGPDGLLAGIKGSGFKVTTITKDAFFEFAEKGKKPYYLRYDKGNGYAWVTRVKDAVPANPPSATADMAHLLSLNKDVIVELKNDAAGMDSRRAAFQELRKQFESLIKYKRNENEDAKKLKKLALTNQLDEAERFLVETESLLVTWSLPSNTPNPVGRGDIAFVPLPGTELQKSLEGFATKSSYFANIEKPANPIVFGKLNVSVDPQRVARAKEFYKASRPAVEDEIQQRPDDSNTPEQKAAAKTAANKFLDIIDKGCDMGVVDLFANAHAVAPGKNVFLCGIRASNGKEIDEILKLLSQLKSGWKLKPEVVEHGGVAIHEVSVPEAQLANFQKFFAGHSSIFVGTSADVVWGAAGEDAVNQLKSAIDQAAKPAPATVDPVVITYELQPDKLTTLLDAMKLNIPETNVPKTPEQIKEQDRAKKELEKYRNLATAAMNGCSALMKGELKRTGNKMEGHLEINECVMKYIGSMIADGVKVIQ